MREVVDQCRGNTGKIGSAVYADFGTRKWRQPPQANESAAVNPVTAAMFGAVLLDEPASANLIIGLIAVLAGICITQAGQARISAHAR